ncbi:dihydroxyacetone kinase subunit DhaK [Streptomyces sp. NPDC087850]|uniref:dihydroxyacetone kinase subunit DhaK n=1 Tax=Streptomyces sp. NPDC087850 TaxID=3365809 RepID=UPI0037FBD4BF
MPHFLTSSAVRDGARGLAISYPHVAVTEDPLILWSRDRDPARRVALISGGGSGHEPLHTGLLGVGGLDAVAPGELFASPHAGQITAASLAAANAVDTTDVLHIVLNYTGDRVNFAASAAQLHDRGISVAQVVVDDDVATTGSGAGRRGTAATVIVEKLLGAAADQGATLDGLADLGRRIVERSRSIAVTARAHTSPTTQQPAFALGREWDYGSGIHGERGARTINALRPTASVISRMIADILDPIKAGITTDGVILLVNGLGGATELELRSISHLATEQLSTHGVTVAAVAAGTYTAALDTSGFSLSLTALSPGWLDLWTAPTDTPIRLPAGCARTAEPSTPATPEETRHSPRRRGRRVVLERLAHICGTVRADLTRLDQHSGDGDFGDNFVGGVTRAVAEARREGTAGMTALADEFVDRVGGTSGPLFGTLFQYLATAMGTEEDQVDIPALATASAAALESISLIGGAGPGDRTMVDALAPAADALCAAADGRRPAALTAAARAAIRGAHETAELKGQRGRASYVGAHALGTPDPGAVAVALIYTVLAQTYEPEHTSDLPDFSHLTSPTAPITKAAR